MATLQEPFASKLAGFLLWIVRSLLYPSYVTFNSLTSLYFPTFEEEQKESKFSLLCKKVLFTPPHAVVFLLLLPVTASLLPVRCLLLRLRRSFHYSERHNERTACWEKSARKIIQSGNYKFGVGSSNICLLPELLSRMNHLSNVNYRSVNIGLRIKEDQLESDLKSARGDNLLISCNGSTSSLSNGNGNGETKLEGNVSMVFPHLDVLCVQEAWSSYHNKALISELHESFPYIVHDVGVHAFNINSFLLGSGHLVASRHPIEVVDFKPYKNFVKHGKIISMGVTSIKIQLGPTRDNGKNVAYVFNTHLQSYQGEHKIIEKELDELLEYSREFVQENHKADDNIAFSIVCGDFNMDNMSPADQEQTRHQLFELFEDFPRLEPGVDKPWTVGTEMRQDRMMDGAVSSPRLLQQALQDKVLRQCYLLDADVTEHTKETLVYSPVKLDDQGNIRAVPHGGRRRIDYILFDKEFPVEVKGYHFVTRLATLTDHIPVTMEFTCPNLL